MEPIDCLCFNLRRAARAASRAYDQELAPLGLRITQFSVLAALCQLGPSPISELAQAMAMERTTLTRNLRPLERDGLVEQVPGQDRRQRIVRVTRAGRALFARAKPRWRKVNAAVMAQVGEQRSARLLRDLKETAAQLS